jgi:biotin transport system substrate-specific component
LPLKKLTTCALFTALITILAQISIPLPFSPVPFTGQVLGIFLAAILLGGKAGLLAVIAYLLLGAAGAPVFSFARGGIHMLTGPGGGYLIGFIPAVYCYGRIMEIKSRPYFQLAAGGIAIALLFIYFFGALQLALIMRYTPLQALMIGVVPYIPLDLLKAVLALFLANHIKKSLQRNRLDHILK